MNIITTPNELKEQLKNIKGSIGFVPTMGALHNGHISLIKKAKDENEIVVVSIFVNPTQFLAGEDLDKYPKKEQADIRICNLCNVDILFMPQISSMYGEDEVLVKAPNIKGFVLEGLKRPGHFDGVLQIVLKLFNLVKPTNAYFGKKDAQQLFLIEQMVRNLYLDVNIVPCDIVRENDGLAMSSRNVYLEQNEREIALSLSTALRTAASKIRDGEKNISNLKSIMSELLKETQLEYIEIVSRNFDYLEEVEVKNSIILVAAKVGATRLIDNIWV